MTLKIQEELKNKFYMAVMNENLDKIKILIEKPSLRKFIDVNVEDNLYLRSCLHRQNKVLIQYFLDAKLVPDKDLKLILENELKMACMQNNMDWFKEFCKEGIFHQYLAVENNTIECFRNAYLRGSTAIIKTLVHDFGVSRNEEKIVHIMREITNCERFKEVINIFNAKKLHDQLQQNLAINSDEQDNNKLRTQVKI